MVLATDIVESKLPHEALLHNYIMAVYHPELANWRVLVPSSKGDTVA